MVSDTFPPPPPLHTFSPLHPAATSFSNSPKEHYREPCVFQVSILGAYLIASGFFSVFGMCVDTLFLCFCE